MLKISKSEEAMHIIEAMVKEIINYHQDIELDENLYHLGLDSAGVISLVVQLEEIFNIMYEDIELCFENFRCIKVIVQKVLREN